MLQVENLNKIGDAIMETSSDGNSNNQSWHSDYSYFLNDSKPFFSRGSGWGYNTGAGTFAFGCHNGYCVNGIGFRVVLVVE